MRLYSSFDRVDNELRELGIRDGAPLTPEDLFPHDSLHYEGTAAVDAAALALARELSPLSPSSSAELERAAVSELLAGALVLDVGSGFGGPARYLAHTHGCRVAALELQPDAHAKATELSRRCGLLLQPDGMGRPAASGGAWHAAGDVMAPFDELTARLARAGAPAGRGAYGAVLSQNCFFHISDKPAILARCAELLRDGGLLYVEDFFQGDNGAFTDAEAAMLRDEVFCAALPTRQAYCAALDAAGFDVVAFDERTTEWTAYVTARHDTFVARRARQTRVHGAAGFEDLRAFYCAIATLFQGGRLGGVRFLARKRAQR